MKSTDQWEKLRHTITHNVKACHREEMLQALDEAKLLGTEPYGGNIYKPHPVEIVHGVFWRCKHNNTGYTNAFLEEFIGCEFCKKDDLPAYFEWKKANHKIKIFVSSYSGCDYIKDLKNCPYEFKQYEGDITVALEITRYFLGKNINVMLKHSSDGDIVLGLDHKGFYQR